MELLRMAYFKKTEAEQAEAEVAGLLKQKTRLSAEEAKQRATLDAAVAARKKSLRTDEVIDSKAVAAALAADTALAAIKDALNDIDADIVAAQAKLAAAHEHERRQAEAAAREADLAAAQGAFTQFLTGAEQVVETFGKLAGPFSEAANVAGFVKNAAAELALAAPAVFGDVQNYISGVINGRTQIFGYTPPAPAPSRPKPVSMTGVYRYDQLPRDTASHFHWYAG